MLIDGDDRVLPIVIEFARAHPEQYDPEFVTNFHNLVAKLDPPSAD